MSDYDVVIAGGGMVGATLASLLAVALPELRVAVVEGRQPESMPAADAEWSNRVSAVSGPLFTEPSIQRLMSWI